VVTVGADAGEVEQRLAAGGLACPDCSAVLAGWGRARGRQVRDTGGGLWIVPRRARCTGCGVTHVLLPVTLLLRRADTAEVIGAGLTARAAGVGHRRVAAGLERPTETVRGWLRRFATRLGPVRAVFTWWCRALATDPQAAVPGPQGSTWADTVAVIAAAAAAVSARYRLPVGPGSGAAVAKVACWETAVTVSAGRLLAPGWPGPDAWSGSTRVAPAASRSSS
jgi:Domain of unknown function (DUF6431)